MAKLRLVSDEKRQPDAALADLVGDEPRSHSEVLDLVWQYIKQHGLNNESGHVNLDRRLRTIFGGQKKVSIFLVSNMVGKHLT